MPSALVFLPLDLVCEDLDVRRYGRVRSLVAPAKALGLLSQERDDVSPFAELHTERLSYRNIAGDASAIDRPHVGVAETHQIFSSATEL
jgi:hypothetical protein